MAMKTACCGKSLRTVALILLYFNLIANVWGLLTTLTSIGDSSYKQFYEDNVSIYLDLILTVVGSLIYLFAIISISREKPSIPLLTACVVFLLFDGLYLIYGVIRLNAGGGMRAVFDKVVEKETSRKPQRDQEIFRNIMKDSYSAIVVFVYLVVLASLAFKAYCVLVIHSFKIDLKTRPVYSVPVRQNADDRSMGQNVQYAAPLYPSQPMQYPQSVPGQYPGQVLYPSQPQPYLGQPQPYPGQPQPYPPQGQCYPSQPPQYPNQPPQYTYETK